MISMISNPSLRLMKLIRQKTILQNLKKRLNFTPISTVRSCSRCLYYIYLRFLSLSGLPCDAEGIFLPLGTPPPPWDYPPPNDYSPFADRGAFELADLIFRKEQMSGANINELLQIWASTLPPDKDPPFINKQHLYNTIDEIELGDAPWHSFSVLFDGEVAEGDTTPWKHTAYDIWYRDPLVVLKNQLKNPDFANEMDFAPKEVRDENDKRRYCDFMSGDWVWRQAVSVMHVFRVLRSSNVP